MTRTPPIDPALIRNVVLVGPSRGGKTTLVEGLARETGAQSPRGAMAEGAARGESEDGLSLTPLDWQGHRLNILDTHGYADAVGEVRAGLRAADAALFVVSASEGVDPATTQLWEECEAVGMPRAIVLTKADHDEADVESTVEECQDLFGGGQGVLPLYLPLHSDDEIVAGLIAILTLRIRDYSTGSCVDRAPDPQHLDLIADARSALLELIITASEDEHLMDMFLSGGDIAMEGLVSGMEQAVRSGHLYPMLVTTTSPEGLGMEELLDILVTAFPSPRDQSPPMVTAPDGSPREPIACDPDGPLCAEVVQTVSNSDDGTSCLVRVFSGTLRPDVHLHVAGLHSATRVVTTPPDTTSLGAGDMGAVMDIPGAEAGVTLSSPDHPLLLEPWGMPHPRHPVTIRDHSPEDVEGLVLALRQMALEDPSLTLEVTVETGQILLWCMDEAHADVISERLSTRHGISVTFETPRVDPASTT